MPDKPFVVTDRRKFTSEGELRPNAERTPREEAPEAPRPQAVAEPAAPPALEEPKQPVGSDDVPPMPPAPSQEERDKSSAAYNTLVDHLDTMVRASDPAQGPIPPVNFANIVHSVYMNAVMQLGLAAPEGQKPRPDILGARQSIDMLGVLAEKTKNNLTEDEDRLLQTVLFELRLTFIEVTQAISRAAQQQQTPPPPPGPSIVR
ncbi:MAG: DUF1844 domain-containing protein [Acidobacteriaceae bacterium]|nr:DUF1844 domain-containing protein [Acidobacteriaceae bacterium]